MPLHALTDHQKSRAKPWIVGVLALNFSGLLSYVALAAYVGLSFRPIMWVIYPWIATTEIIRRIAVRVCIRRLERICGMNEDYTPRGHE